jgi:hypothetical protein
MTTDLNEVKNGGAIPPLPTRYGLVLISSRTILLFLRLPVHLMVMVEMHVMKHILNGAKNKYSLHFICWTSEDTVWRYTLTARSVSHGSPMSCVWGPQRDRSCRHKVLTIVCSGSVSIACYISVKRD